MPGTRSRGGGADGGAGGPRARRPTDRTKTPEGGMDVRGGGRRGVGGKGEEEGGRNEVVNLE